MDGCDISRGRLVVDLPFRLPSPLRLSWGFRASND
jgi:hypothetical protein